MDLTDTYGAPLKFTYFPKISENIIKAKGWFENSIKKHKYLEDCFYSYCTKISFTITLADSWVINKLFIMLFTNKWNKKNNPVLLGGLTYYSEGYYNSEQHINEMYLPVYEKDNLLYIAFFNTGVYQESIGGFSGLQHCLIPHPKKL